MKNILVVLGLLCCFQAYSQRKPNIKGNRNVTEVREELPAFDKIELIDNLEVFVEGASTNAYTISGDDNLIDILKFKVEDRTLLISSFYNITSKKRLEITIYCNELVTLSMQDGTIKTRGSLSADRLDITASGYAKMELNAKAGLLNLHMEGNSSGDFNFESDSLNINLTDKVDARIFSIGERNTVELKKNASARLEGTAAVLQATIYGGAKLKAERLEANTIEATVQESTTAWLFAVEEFKLSSRGSARTYLHGSPQITISEFLNTSELLKR